jgi:hypothetical protein
MVIRRHHKIAVLAIAVLALVFLLNVPVSAGTLTTWISIGSGTSKDLNGVWGSDSGSVFAAGNSGTILHFDGSNWSSMSSGTISDLSGVWGANDSHVFAVGKSGTILNYDGISWGTMTSGTSQDLNSVWGTDSSNVFAAGNSGVILRFDGSTWKALNSGTTMDIYDIWGADVSNVFAVGKSGTILRYGGSTWSQMSSGTTSDLYSIWGADVSNVFAVGKSGSVLHYTGSTWSQMSIGTTVDLNSIWGADAKDVYMVGKSGTIMYYDGSKFSSMNRNTINDLRSVWGFSSFNVVAAGGSGILLRYTPPGINSISRDQGDQGANLDVTLTGQNLSGASEVGFGQGIAVNSFTVVNSTQIAVNITIVPIAIPGTRDVSVTTQGGSYLLPNSFKVNQAVPTISSISPFQDRQGATLKVTIGGTGLGGISEVRLGTGIAVNGFTILSPNQMTVNITIAGDAAPGARDVSITTPGGGFTLPAGFMVKQALPTITSISPIQGNQEASLDVTISGANLTGVNEVRMGPGITVNSIIVLSSNQAAANITMVAGAQIGVRDVSVTTPGGSFTLAGSFTVKQALPTITSVSPTQGSQGATLDVYVNGTNLLGSTEIRLGTGIAVSSFSVLGPNQIAAKITIVAGTETGARDVSVTTPGGSFALPNSFKVNQAPPTITSINLNQGDQGTTLNVIISGRNFDGVTSISFGTGVTVQNFNVLSPTQLSVNIVIDDKAVTGLRDISITTPGGSSTLSNNFNIKERPLGTLVVALIWIGIAAVVFVFILVLNKLRQKRADKIDFE